MKNKYFKKWKKSHRQRRKKREIIVILELEPSTLEKLKKYCERHRVKSLQKAMRKILKNWYIKEAERIENESR